MHRAESNCTRARPTRQSSRAVGNLIYNIYIYKELLYRTLLRRRRGNRIVSQETAAHSMQQNHSSKIAITIQQRVILFHTLSRFSLPHICMADAQIRCRVFFLFRFPLDYILFAHKGSISNKWDSNSI